MSNNDTDKIVSDLIEQAEKIYQFCDDNENSLQEQEVEDLRNEAGSLRRKARRIEALGVFELFTEIRSLVPSVKKATSRLNEVSKNLETVKEIMTAAAAAINLAAAISIGDAGGVVSSLQQAGKAIETLSS
ncbi:hypothetical protein [Pseudodesulfovibrio sediminis]|uniref:Chemotaxis protein n=1 Tax=Pseudodesulfovibrio sediminis TaxID=2810563 RepID=A0ABN6ES75_9BACT|nr:hypothetical protein [Pseudodesulfovibrio sediminis]BCS87989.1 hypothetical protein PSDVSF_12310 [Pseudodesulfovibrio sediminis]